MEFKLIDTTSSWAQVIGLLVDHTDVSEDKLSMLATAIVLYEVKLLAGSKLVRSSLINPCGFAVYLSEYTDVESLRIISACGRKFIHNDLNMSGELCEDTDYSIKTLRGNKFILSSETATSAENRRLVAENKRLLEIINGSCGCCTAS